VVNSTSIANAGRKGGTDVEAVAEAVGNSAY